MIATAHNRTLTDRDPTAHAEILALRQAAEAIGTSGWSICDLYSRWSRARCAPRDLAGADPAALLRRADAQGRAVESGVRFFAHRPAITCRRDGAVGETEAATLLRIFSR